MAHAVCGGTRPPAAGVLLTSLCCYRDCLPQGSPVSAAVSNLVMRPFDEYMGTWCRERGISYTRYCDDLTFSGDFNVKEVRDKAENFLKVMGFSLNRKKTRVLGRGQRQCVTGIVVNDFPQAARGICAAGQSPGSEISGNEKKNRRPAAQGRTEDKGEESGCQEKRRISGRLRDAFA